VSIEEKIRRMVKKVASFTGLSEKTVEQSLPIGNWMKGYEDFLRDPVKAYKRGIETRKAKIVRYEHLIKKHTILRMSAKTSTAINKHNRMIREYERRIEKLKKSIDRLEKLIEGKRNV